MTSSQTERRIPLAAVVDAVNALPDPAARASVIAALRERFPEEGWFTRNGCLSVQYGEADEDAEEDRIRNDAIDECVEWHENEADASTDAAAIDFHRRAAKALERLQ